MKATAVLAACLLASSVAHADERDPDTALELSVAGTAVAVGIAIPTGNLHNSDWKLGLPLLAVIDVVPSVGHFYAGDYLSPGLIARVVGSGMLVVGLADPFDHGDNFDIASGPGRALGLGGLSLMIGGIVWDLATSRREARRYNAHHVEVLPTALVTDHGPVAGLGLGGRF